MHSISNISSNIRANGKAYTAAVCVVTALAVLSAYNLGQDFRGFGSFGSCILLTAASITFMITVATCLKHRKKFFNHVQVIDGYYKFETQEQAFEASFALLVGQTLPYAIGENRYLLYQNENGLSMSTTDPFPNKDTIIKKSIIRKFFNRPQIEDFDNPDSPLERLSTSDARKYQTILRGIGAQKEYFKCTVKGDERIYFHDSDMNPIHFNGNGTRRTVKMIKLRYLNYEKQMPWKEYFKSFLTRS